jgi:hypothetical protein
MAMANRIQIPIVAAPHAATTKRPIMESALVLGRSSDWWNGAMLISLGVAAFVALLVAAATTGAVIASKREAVAASNELDRYKSQAAIQISEANARALEAQVALEKYKAPRSMLPDERKRFVKLISPSRGKSLTWRLLQTTLRRTLF